MEISHWDEKYIYMLHTFTCNNRVVAEGTSKGVIYNRKEKAVVTPDTVIVKVNEYNATI